MRLLLRMSAGLIAWAVTFCLIYALHGIGCAAGWPGVPVLGISLHRVILLCAWGVGVVAILLLAVSWRRAAPTFGGRAGRLLAWTGFAATAIGGLPILLLPDCL